MFTEDSARKACQEIGGMDDFYRYSAQMIMIGYTGYLHGIYVESGCTYVEGQNVCAGTGYPLAVSGNYE